MYSYKNKKPLDYYNELEPIEIKIYNEQNFDDFNVRTLDNINIQNILEREPDKFEDYDYNIPDSIFLLNFYKGKTIVGRKIRSILRKEGKINAINCSMITAPMLLGFLKERTYEDKKITIEFYPFTNEEKKFIFNEVKKNRNIDIYYPYNFIDFYTNKEKESPEIGWYLNDKIIEILNNGETHIRRFTRKFIKELNKEYKIVYDPACSTGKFLYDYKKGFPNSYTIGHDLSQKMIDYAKDYVDEACCCNAIDSPIKDYSVDLMFLRFLNAEVVNTEDAHKILKALIPKVKKSGLIICFGHSPVLIKKETFEELGLKPIICNGYDEKRNAIFQYYVFEIK